MPVRPLCANRGQVLSVGDIRPERPFPCGAGKPDLGPCLADTSEVPGQRAVATARVLHDGSERRFVNIEAVVEDAGLEPHGPDP